MEFSSYSSYSFSLKGYTMALSQTQARDRKQLFYYNVIYLYRLLKLQSGDIKVLTLLMCLLPLYIWEFQHKNYIISVEKTTADCCYHLYTQLFLNSSEAVFEYGSAKTWVTSASSFFSSVSTSLTLNWWKAVKDWRR